MLSPKPETFKNPDGAKLNSSSGVTIQSEGIMDISDNVPDHSMGQISGNLSENVRSKREDEKWTASGLKSPISEQTPNNHEQVIHRGKLDVEALKGCSHNVSWNYHCWCLNWFWFAMLLRCKRIQWMVYQLILINIMKLEKSDRQSEE